MPDSVEPGDEPTADPHFVLTVSRDADGWIGRLTGPHLPAEGVTARSATLAGVERATAPLYPSKQMMRDQGGEGSGYSTRYRLRLDFGPDFATSREGFIQAGVARRDADRDYWRRGHEAATALAGQEGVTLADIADILHVSAWEASRLLAYEPQPVGHRGFHVHRGGVRHWIREHARPAVEYAAPFAVRQARVLAAEALRKARQRRARAAR